MKNKIHMEVIRRDKGWICVKFAKKKFFMEVLRSFVENSPFLHKAKSLEVNLLLTNEIEMQSLNKRFLEKDKTTNVLAFPDKDYDYRYLNPNDFEGDIILGDIAFGLEVIEKEAEFYKISMQNHFTHLFIHAILHLVGYDHENEEDYEIMLEEEIKLLNKMQISRPPIYE
ncbi:MAG: rRNA maturation RNase YbeY [Rickettsiaceae bacterium]|nr:rRNA maturation RNase YbeY [Rickettsiaceae bacterium]